MSNSLPRLIKISLVKPFPTESSQSCLNYKKSNKYRKLQVFESLAANALQ